MLAAITYDGRSVDKRSGWSDGGLELSNETHKPMRQLAGQRDLKRLMGLQLTVHDVGLAVGKLDDNGWHVRRWLQAPKR
ncbi:unnamed protein product, partial [Citrullus colocynthis]